MESKLRTTKTVSETIKGKSTEQKVPAGAEIVRNETRTEVEEIENGFLITKHFDIQYKAKGKDYSDWINYTKKWYSKTDPLEINMKDTQLADAFD